MAEGIGIASGSLALAGFALQTSLTLYSTIRSFKHHNQRVTNLTGELQALTEVLDSLRNIIGSTVEIDLSLLHLPLLQCGHACKDFEQVLLKCASRAGADQTSFRGWARLTYMSDDIDGFKKQIEGYKSTIVIALTQANLKSSILTAEQAEAYRTLIKTTTDDLQTHLERIDGKLENILERTAAGTDTDAVELRVMEQERLSTQKRIQFCAQLSDHINQMQLRSQQEDISSGLTGWNDVPNKIVNQGLQECKTSLSVTITKLEEHMKDVTDRLIKKSRTTNNVKDEIDDLTRLQDTWQAARQCRDFCSRADDQLKENISVIDNCATGNAVQFMVSTNGQILHGKNQGNGPWIRQIGGHISDTAVIQISRDISGATRDSVSNDSSTKNSPTGSPSDMMQSEQIPNSKDRKDRSSHSASQLVPNTSMPLMHSKRTNMTDQPKRSE